MRDKKAFLESNVNMLIFYTINAYETIVNFLYHKTH